MLLRADEETLRQLAALGGLVGLRLVDAEVTDWQLANLAGTLTELVVLGLENSPGVTDDGIQCLASLGQLAELHLRGSSVTDEGVRRLRESHPNRELQVTLS